MKLTDEAQTPLSNHVIIVGTASRKELATVLLKQPSRTSSWKKT